MDRLIEIRVNGNHLWKDSNLAGVQGEYNVTHLRITFDEGWDGYAKTITFFDAKGQNPVKRILTTALLEDAAKDTRVYRVAIPGEPLAEAGWCSVVIDGLEGDVRQRTAEDELKVLPAKDGTAAGEPADPTPTLAEQLQEQIDAIIEDVKGAAECAKHVEQTAQDAEEARASAEAAARSESAAQDAQEAAEDAQAAAEQAARDAQAVANGLAGGTLATTGYVDKKASTAEANANKYTDDKLDKIPTPDVSGQIDAHNTSADAHADIRGRAEWAIQNAMNAYELADTKAHYFYCYLDVTSLDEVDDEFANGRIVMLCDNYELWPLVYAEEGYQYKFRMVGDSTVKTATLDYDGWTVSEEELGGDDDSSASSIPTNHASNSTTYGTGSTALYGHVKLSDATDSYYGSSSGIAASPKAVKAAYDKAKEALAAAEALEARLARARLGTVTLLASTWTSNGNLHAQVVEIDDVTENSQVDLTPSVEQLAIFYEKDLTFVTENDGGVVTVYAIGQKPTNDYTIQVTITEVSA